MIKEVYKTRLKKILNNNHIELLLHCKYFRKVYQDQKRNGVHIKDYTEDILTNKLIQLFSTKMHRHHFKMK